MCLYFGSEFKHCNYLYDPYYFYVMFCLVLCFVHVFSPNFSLPFCLIFLVFFGVHPSQMCTWVEMEVSWGRCRVLCRMYERGKEVVRQLLSQPGLSRAPSWVFTLFCFWLLNPHS